MKLVGITGNIGAGKSYISNIFANIEDVYYYSMDEHIKLQQETDPWLIDAMKTQFGNDIYTDLGLDRKKVGDIIFNDPSKKKLIEDMIKGPAMERLYKTYYNIKSATSCKLFLVENAILYETGQYKTMDHVILVDAPVDVRMKRCIEQRGMTEEDFKQRNDVQIPFADKANALSSEGIEWTHIWNSSELPGLKKELRKIFTKLTK